MQLVDGVRVGNMMGGSRTQQTLSPLLYDEVDVQLSGQGGEAVSIGVTTNSIPRSGGNRFSGTILANGSGPDLQTSNLTSRLMGLGLTATSSLKSLFDVNGSLGGPIVKDRLWFYATERYQTNSTYAAGIFYDVNPLPTPGNLTRVATGDQGYNPQYLWDNTGRLTAAVTPKLRMNGLAIVQRKWWPYFPGVSATVSPESVEQITWPGRIYQGSATYAATSRLLFEGGMNYQDSSDWWAPVPIANNIGGNAVRVVEQGTTLANGTVISPITYGPLTPNLVSDNPMKMRDYRAAMNYVTGTHNLKIGIDTQQGYRQNQWLNLTTPIQYRTLGYQLNQVTLFAPPGTYKTNLDYDAGIFAQDRWTTKRLTVTAAIRLDLQKESYDPSSLGPTQWLPNRATQTIPGANVVDWKDINPRFGVAYDVFGDGKTALKVSAARGVAGETIATALALNPGSSFVTSTRHQRCRREPRQHSGLQFPELAGQWGMQRLGDADVRQRDSLDAAGSGDAQRLEQAPVELGVLGRRAARGPAAPVCRHHVLPPRQRRVPRDGQHGDHRSGLHAVQPDGPDRSAAAHVRPDPDVLRRQPRVEERRVWLDDEQPHHLRVELRQPVPALERLRSHGELPAVWRCDRHRRRDARPADARQLRHRVEAA